MHKSEQTLATERIYAPRFPETFGGPSTAPKGHFRRVQQTVVAAIMDATTIRTRRSLQLLLEDCAAPLPKAQQAMHRPSNQGGLKSLSV